jgi:hypothetical protein
MELAIYLKEYMHKKYEVKVNIWLWIQLDSSGFGVSVGVEFRN